MKTITFYSYKGGVGRSLALANIATRLAEFDRKVCVLDFDLEAPGLQFKFAQYSFNRRIERGIVDYIHDFSTKGLLQEKIKPYTTSFSVKPGKKNIDLIPAGDINSSEYWKKLSGINWFDLLYENDDSLSFFLDLKEKIKSELNPDYLLIDSRTGISEISGITLSLLADEVVIVAANNRENITGARRIIQSLSNEENAILGKLPKLTFVLSRIPFTEKPDDKAREQILIGFVKRSLLPTEIDINIIHSDRELELEEKIKIGYEKDESAVQIAKDYLHLFRKLVASDLSEDEVRKFEDIYESEKLYKKALKSNSIDDKISLISEAIILNNTNPEFFHFRANIYYKIHDYPQAIHDYNKAISLDENNMNTVHNLGNCYYFLKDYAAAINCFNKMLQHDEFDADAYVNLGLVAHTKNEFDLALHYYSKAIELNPTLTTAYNNRANLYKNIREFDLAMNDIYIALELNSDYSMAHVTLAEIHAELGNDNEFYLHFENSLKIDELSDELNESSAERALKTETIYKKYLNQQRFLNLLDRYNIAYEV